MKSLLLEKSKTINKFALESFYAFDMPTKISSYKQAYILAQEVKNKNISSYFMRRLASFQSQPLSKKEKIKKDKQRTQQILRERTSQLASQLFNQQNKPSLHDVKDALSAELYSYQNALYHKEKSREKLFLRIPQPSLASSSVYSKNVSTKRQHTNEIKLHIPTKEGFSCQENQGVQLHLSEHLKEKPFLFG